MIMLPSMTEMGDSLKENLLCCQRPRYAPNPLEKEELCVEERRLDQLIAADEEQEARCASFLRRRRALVAAIIIITISATLAAASVIVAVAAPSSELGQGLRSGAQLVAAAFDRLLHLLDGKRGSAPHWQLALVLAFSSSTDSSSPIE